ncbi:MAG: glycosyltransferase family 2 protein [Candidatus Bathyarchaeia archaeon]
MYKNRRVCVVVPAYNEAKHISKVIRGIPDFVDHIVVVDDASTDNTADIARSATGRVEVTRHSSNQGLGGALITGHKRAIELNADISVIMGGDDQMDPRYLPALLDAIIDDGYDYAKGNRFMASGLEKMPKLRILGNSVLSFLTKTASGYWRIFDPQNGYTAIRVKILKSLDLDAMQHGYQFENDMLVRLNILGARVKDVPIPAVYKGEQSKVRLLPFAVRTSICLFKDFHVRLYRKYILYDLHPFALLYVTGASLFSWGSLLSAYFLYLRYVSTERISPSTGSVMIAAIPLFIGIQLLLTALLVDLEEGRRLS